MAIFIPESIDFKLYKVIRQVQSLLYFFSFVILGAIVGDAKGYLLDLHSGIIPVCAQEPYRIKSRSGICKASSLTTLPSFWPTGMVISYRSRDIHIMKYSQHLEIYSPNIVLSKYFKQLLMDQKKHNSVT